MSICKTFKHLANADGSCGSRERNSRQLETSVEHSPCPARNGNLASARKCRRDNSVETPASTLMSHAESKRNSKIDITLFSIASTYSPIREFHCGVLLEEASRIRRVFEPSFSRLCSLRRSPAARVFSLFRLRITIHAIGHCARAAKSKPIPCKQEHCFTPPRPIDCDFD